MHRTVETPVFASTPMDRGQRGEWPLFILFFVMLAFRLWYASVRQLVPDEAYYWVWSRHLAAGYLDHPAMVALMIRLGTAIAGQSELGVRWPGVLLAIGTSAVMWAVARRLLNPLAARWVAGILLLGPILNVVGTIITPDTPLLFFCACGLYCALRAAQGERGWWIGFGLAAGLGLDSKYTMVLLGATVALALLSCQRGRREFLRPWVWLAALIAIALFLPVIEWNAQHRWVSFAYQLNHGTTAKANEGTAALSHLNDVLAYVGGQMAVYTPVLFVMGIITLVKGWRRFGKMELDNRILLLTATLPLVLFAFSSLRRRPEPNWPLMAYLPLTLLIVQDVFEWTAAARAKPAKDWLRLGLIVAVCGTVLLHGPEVLWAVAPWVRVKNFEEQFGWRQLASQVDAAKREADLANDPSATPVFCDTYQMASELSFYLSGQPQVWTLSVDRPTMLDYLPGRPDPGTQSRLVFVRSGLHTASTPRVPGLAEFTNQTAIDFNQHVLKHVLRQCTIIVAKR